MESANSPTACQIRKTPLNALHRRLAAKMVNFGGWDMPVEYPATGGLVAEHKAVRGRVGLFDVSHLGTVRVEGAEAFDHLQRTLTNDLRKIAPGRAQYTHLLDDDGSVLDDIIVWWVDAERFDVMPNASNTERVVGAIPEHVVKVAESGIRGPDDARRLAGAGFDAILVGEALVRSADPGAAVGELRCS